MGDNPGQAVEELVTAGIQKLGDYLTDGNTSVEDAENIKTGINLLALVLKKGKGDPSKLFSNTGKVVGKGTQLNSKTLWKGKGKERIDVENPNPSQRPGQVHYQDNAGGKYIYDPVAGQFKNAPAKINDLLKNPEFKKGIEKGLKYLGY